MLNFKLKINQNWNNKKIAFVSILIATCISWILIFVRIAPIASIPPFKLMIAGLPIKLTGYIFGPVIGGITGAISDIVSFALAPVFFNIFYTLCFVFFGFIPGIISFFMNKMWLSREEVKKERIKKISIYNFIFTILVLSSILIFAFLFVFLSDENIFQEIKFVGKTLNKWIFFMISIFGLITILIFVLCFSFLFKKETFNSLLPIITFSILLEWITNPLSALGDYSSFTNPNQKAFFTILASHFFTSPFKIWINVFVIFFAYKIVSPLIYKKQNNGW